MKFIFKILIKPGSKPFKKHDYNFSVLKLIFFFLPIPQTSSYCAEGEGCEYFFNSKSIKSSACGRAAICRWNLKFYLEKQAGVVIPPDLPTPAALGESIATFMDSIGYPEVPFSIQTCVEGEEECKIWLNMLIEAECKRLVPELPKPPEAGREPTGLKPYNKEGINRHLWRQNDTYLTPNYNGFNHFPITCPLFRQSWTLYLLLSKNNVYYEENIMFAELGTLIKRPVLLDMWCDLVDYTINKLYRMYSAKNWCRGWKRWEVFVCVNHNDPPQPPDLDMVLELCNIPWSEDLPKHLANVALPDYTT